MRARGLTVPLLCSLAIVAGAPAALAGGTSLYSGPGPRPGPDVLYGAPAVAPQLENVGVWSAAPILVSGASAYRGGEFLYQDFLYDDHGAAEAPDPTDPKGGGNLFSKPDGTYTYPTDPAYANDAADVVELRVKPLSDATAFRLTLNTMKDASLVAFSIAIGGTPGVLRSFPAGANVQAPAALFLTVHPAGAGMAGDLVNAATGQPVGGLAPLVAVDTGHRQIEVRVPHAAWDPGGQVVRLAAGVGLWEKASGRYLLPQAAADATHPGGAGTAVSPAAFFNVAFRYDEPMPEVGDPTGTATGPAWWRDKHQGEALAAGDISALHADVDFAKLAAAVNDDMPGQPGGVPQTGPMDRILVSGFEIAQGVDFSVNCFPQSEPGGASCPGQYQGVLQPYAIYVPSGPMPRRGYGMTLLLHSLSTNYNQYLGSRNQSQFGDRDGGSIVITPESRGPADRLRPHRREIRQLRLPLRARRLHAERAPDARDQRSVRAGRRVPRPGEGEPQPRARHLRRRPDPRLPRARLRRGPRVLAVRDETPQLDAAGHGWPRPGQHRRALIRIRRRRPDAVGHAVRRRHAQQRQPPPAARLHSTVPDLA